MTFSEILSVLGENKEIQVYGGKRIPVTKPKKEWMAEGNADTMKCPVYKVKDRPTDTFIFVELGEAPAEC